MFIHQKVWFGTERKIRKKKNLNNAMSWRLKRSSSEYKFHPPKTDKLVADFRTVSVEFRLESCASNSHMIAIQIGDPHCIAVDRMLPKKSW